jgi:hypothetical protein
MELVIVVLPCWARWLVVGRLVGQGPLAASFGKQGIVRQTIFTGRLMTFSHKQRSAIHSEQKRTIGRAAQRINVKNSSINENKWFVGQSLEPSLCPLKQGNRA